MNTDNMRERAVAVSVVVPVYNVEKYIERCLDSLVRQKFGYEYEIIIVNDGTKDNSMTIADRFASEYDFIRIISKTQAFQPQETQVLQTQEANISPLLTATTLYRPFTFPKCIRSP